MLLLITSFEEKRLVAERLIVTPDGAKHIFIGHNMNEYGCHILPPARVLARGVKPNAGFKVYGNEFLGFIINIGYLVVKITDLDELKAVIHYEPKDMFLPPK